jgi:hypothetical protein
MQDSSDISDSTAVEAHLHNLMFDASPSSRMTIIKDESATQTFRIIAGVTLLTFGRFAVFRDISRMAVGTLNSEPNSHATL